MPCTPQQIYQHFAEIGEGLLLNGDQDLDGVLQGLAQLQAQTDVLKTLESVSQILRRHSEDSFLPDQLAGRVKHFIKFVYESPRNKGRSTQLRKLNCNALKVCGLAYTIRAILGLPDLRFKFLVEHIEDFVRLRGLAKYLYRDDINKAVEHKVNPDDEDLYREFLICLFNHHGQHA